MLEHTKKPATANYVELCFRVPLQSVKKAKDLLGSLGAKDVRDSVPWEEVYSDFGPHIALRGARKRETLTQKRLAEKLGVDQSHISEMENGKRPIGKKMAKRLAETLGADYRVFL